MSDAAAAVNPDGNKSGSGAADERELVITRTLNAPRDLVYRAWTDPEHLTHWWGPRGMTTPEVEMDLRPGGIFRTVMRAPDGTEYPNVGVFLEVVPSERVVSTDAYGPGWKPSEKPFMTAVITFEDAEGGRTKVTARALHWNTADRDAHEQMGFFGGWGESMDRFAEYVATTV